VTVAVVCADARTVEQQPVIECARWQSLAADVLRAEGVTGELTLTFVDRSEIAELNAAHMGEDGPTDVLSFPLDDEPVADVPTLLGDVVVSPAVAADQCPTHAGTLDDELALLVVHGILHVLGYDHAAPEEDAAMRARELEHLVALHWGGPAPAGFRRDHPAV
jgi:probable rRNA maturation factor